MEFELYIVSAQKLYYLFFYNSTMIILHTYVANDRRKAPIDYIRGKKSDWSLN